MCKKIEVKYLSIYRVYLSIYNCVKSALKTAVCEAGGFAGVFTLVLENYRSAAPVLGDLTAGAGILSTRTGGTDFPGLFRQIGIKREYTADQNRTRSTALQLRIGRDLQLYSSD